MGRDFEVARGVIIALVVGLAGVLVVGVLAGTGRVTIPGVARPSPSPSPTYDHSAFWLVQGQVLDAATERPIEGVCVIIGPVFPCQPNMPHTDGNGKWSVELPNSVQVAYDFHFVRDGYLQTDVNKLYVTADLNFPVKMQRAP